MAAGQVWIQDVDLDSLGVQIERVTGWIDGPDIRQPAVSHVGRLGRNQLTDEPTAEARVGVITGWQKASTFDDLLVNAERLKTLAYEGIVRVRLGHRPDREFLGVAKVQFSSIGHVWNPTDRDQVAKHLVTITVRCDDPAPQELAPTVLDFSGGATPVPLWSAVSTPIFTIGGGTNPVITLQDMLGQVVGQMAFTIALPGSAFIRIDVEKQEIVDQSGGSQAAARTSGQFFDLNPYHGVPVDGPFPRLVATNATHAVAEYRRRGL